MMFGISRFNGIELVISGNAMQRVINWPEKVRSRRLHKKLTKKRGPQITEKPGAWMLADGRMLVHPKLYKQMTDNNERDRP